MLHNSTNNKNEGCRLLCIVWTIVTATMVMIGGLLIASYMVLSEKITIGSANIIANIAIFVSSFVAMVTQANRGGKLLQSGLYLAGMVVAFLLVDMICFGGVISTLWQRLGFMIVSVAFFVIITSRKGKKQFRWRSYAG